MDNIDLRLPNWGMLPATINIKKVLGFDGLIYP